MDIQDLLGRLSGADRTSIQNFERNSYARLKQDPQDTNARELLAAIATERVRRNPPDPDGWTPGIQGDPRYRLRNGEVAALVRRTETHTKTNDGVYDIHVLGKLLKERPRHVECARVIADRMIAEHFGDSGSKARGTDLP